MVVLYIREQANCNYSLFISSTSLFISCEDDNPSVIEYPSLSIGSGNSVTALGCIEGRFTESGEMSIIVACWNEAMYVVNSQEVIDLSIKVFFSCSFHI